MAYVLVTVWLICGAVTLVVGDQLEVRCNKDFTVKFILMFSGLMNLVVGVFGVWGLYTGELS